MPYATNADLNAATKKAHPTPHAQTVFRSAFNNALEEYGDEATAFKVAHAAAGKVSKRKRPAKKAKKKTLHQYIHSSRV